MDSHRGVRSAPRASKRGKSESGAGLIPLRVVSSRLAELDARQRAAARSILEKWVVTSTRIPYIKVLINIDGDKWEVLRGTDIRLCATNGMSPFPDVAREVMGLERGEMEARSRGIEFSEILHVRPFHVDELVDLIVSWSEWQYAGDNELVPAAALRNVAEPRLFEQPCWNLLGDLTARERSIWLLDGSPEEATLVAFEADSLWRAGWRVVDPEDPGAECVRQGVDLYIARVEKPNSAVDGGASEVWSQWEVLPIPHLLPPADVRRVLANLAVPGNFARADSGGNVHVMRSRLGDEGVASIWEAILSASPL